MSVVEDARALLAQFGRSPWRDMHVRTAAGEFFLAKPGGGANPMQVAAPASAPRDLATLSAPHVATLVEVAPVGTRLAEGETVATVELLGERIALTGAGGIVREVAAEPGALLDYAQVIARLEPVGAA